MKRIFNWLPAIACATILATSCYKDGPDSGDSTGALYGVWLLDTQTIITETSVGGNDNENKTVVDFSDTGCYLQLEPGGTASARLGSDIGQSSFSYNPESKRIDFPRGLSVTDKRKVFALIGSYDVTKVNDDYLVLTQEAIGVNIGSVKANETTVYEFHRKEDPNGREGREL